MAGFRNLLTRRKARLAPYRAYKVAWNQRQATDNISPKLLRTAFEEAGVGQEHLNADRAEGRFWFEAWSDGVSPRRLKRRVLSIGISPYKEAWRILRSALAGSDRLPNARQIPNRFETVSADGWELGDVALVPVGSFQPVANLIKVLGDCRWQESDRKKYTELPVWLRIVKADGPVDVMSGEDCIGRISADPEYLARLAEARTRRRDLVPDGTVLVRLDGQQLKFKKLRVHVYTRLSGDAH